MRLGWNESHVNAYNQRQGKYPAKKQRKPETKKVALKPIVLSPDAIVAADIPWLTPRAGEWQRMHFRARKRVMVAIAKVVWVSIKAGVRPNLPLNKSHVVITRYGSVEPDPDGLNFVKPILDALQVASKRHPYGIGVIVDDSSAHCSYVSKWVKASRSSGRVTIEVFNG